MKPPQQEQEILGFIKPMLAKEVEQPFDNENWIFEIKWDGYRAISIMKGHSVSIYSRNGNSFNNSYPAIVKDLERLNINAVFDGEIVVTDKEGKPVFELLQDYGNSHSAPIYYYVFDLLSLNGKNVCHLPLIERKKMLRQLLPKNAGRIRYADHIQEKGKMFFKNVCKKGLEGMMAKNALSEYYPGQRTNEWLKVKQHKTEDVVIAGFTQPTGGRKYFGALVLGTWKNKTLKYVGHTGSGFSERTLREMYDMLKPLIQEEPPFQEKVKTNMPVTWVQPKLVCEIKFTERTSSGSMRHPIFLHVRTDKPSKEVTIDSKQSNPKYSKEKSAKNQAAKKRKVNKSQRAVLHKKHSETNGLVEVSNEGKLYWPKEGITKGDVVKYYQNISKIILPYLKGRPESLKRNPNGILDNGFFHKDAGVNAPNWVDTIHIYSESALKEIDYIICNNEDTLKYMNNLGCIEINPWHSRVGSLDSPDYMIIDLDPSKKNTFGQVIETALVVHDILEKAKAPNFCKTSGATGLHIYVPAGGNYTYDQLKDFAHIICLLTHEQLPDFTSLDRNLQKRGNKTIYLDHLQNRRGQTIASAYSIRPVEGATVSAPLDWKEVKPRLTPDMFTIHSIEKRIKKKGDLFSGILGKGIDLKKCLKLLGQ